MIYPSYNVENPVDTVGAGDSFCSGFLAAFSRGEAVDTCMKTGNAAGAFCVSSKGATAGIKSYGEITGFIKEREA